MAEMRATTNEQKRAILERLYQCWIEIPELRLGQLIDNAVGADGIFYREDERLAEDVERFTFGGK